MGFVLFKFLDKNIKSIKGIDFSSTSIKNAKKKQRNIRVKKQNHF